MIALLRDIFLQPYSTCTYCTAKYFQYKQNVLTKNSSNTLEHNFKEYVQTTFKRNLYVGNHEAKCYILTLQRRAEY
jgi:hypothetical protein